MDSISANLSSAGASSLTGHLRRVDPNLLSAADDERLRETLKRCSPATFEAARQLRLTGRLEYLPTFVEGMIERFVEPDLRGKLREPTDDLVLTADLGLDSLTLMEIVLLAEEVLPVTISNDELRHLQTLGEVKQFIAAKLGEAADREACSA